MIIITIGEMLLMPVSYVLVFERAKESQKGLYVGIYQALNAITFVFSPLMGTYILSQNNNGNVLWTITFILCLIPLSCFMLMHFRSSRESKIL